MESTVVLISIPPPFFQTCFIVFATYLLLFSNTQNKSFFNPINIFLTSFTVARKGATKQMGRGVAAVAQQIRKRGSSIAQLLVSSVSASDAAAEKVDQDNNNQKDE